MITRWNPMRDMIEMQNQIDRMFDDAWRPFYSNESALPLDIDETENGYAINAVVPGVRPEDINVNVHDNILTISGEMNEANEQKDENGKRVLVRERRYGSFSRSVRLASPIDADNIEASYENGILTLEIPKSEEAKPRRIPVNVRETLTDGSNS